jgi:hypothetical protein
MQTAKFKLTHDRAVLHSKSVRSVPDFVPVKEQIFQRLPHLTDEFREVSVHGSHSFIVEVVGAVRTMMA